MDTSLYQASPQNSPLVSVADNSPSVLTLKMDFDLQQSIESEIEPTDLSRFVDQVDLVSRIVIDELGLREFSRSGLGPGMCLAVRIGKSQSDG